MIGILNRLIEQIEAQLRAEINLADLVRTEGSTEYHVRRMFSSLSGMPVSEYIRRRRMTQAAADLLAGQDLLSIAIRYGYGSAEAFGLAFRAVHGASVADVREHGGPLRSQPIIKFSLHVEGNRPMDARIVDREEFQLIGYATQVPLIHNGANPHIQAHIASIPVAEHARLKELSSAQPAGLLQVSAQVDPDYREGSELTYLHGVAVPGGIQVPQDLDMIQAPAGQWAVFSASGPYPSALQDLYAATATAWFPSNPWRLRVGPSIVAVLDRAPDFSTATCELWLPVEAGN
ncbi:AraC family transcriptional regulator [Glutamicibacter arilaitensis]|uniref:AraC family transcriptional regulator n=1 Tax=Glutamicibacter arilaitensis TaxID=256701 RepID=A0A4Y8TSD2_9MICC|nr:AraC family transcriptional regulator [Glutamicibacter arilaitensis]TFH54866.1 AraC family transcriptional regulator [Glutamicibacter arilaitensis]